MSTFKVLLIGLGNFGHTWADTVLPACQGEILFAAAVDQRPERFSYVPENVPCFTEIQTALTEIRPDLVINVTPPTAHTAINTMLLNAGLPVLCEKPAAADLEDAEAMLAVYRKTG